MEKWEAAARSFINSCDFKNDIDAVFLSGSYAAGNADKFSDIDVFIILNDSVNWRERGNKQFDGYNIEYFANPMRQIENYINNNYQNAHITEINMLLGGIVIFDKNSAAQKAIDFCTQKLASEFPKMSVFNIKTGLYHLWDGFDELTRGYSNKTPDFVMHFFKFVQSAFELYSRYICSPVPNHHKLFRWLTDSDYSKKYGLAVYNDQVFLKMVRSAFEISDDKAMFDLSKDIYEYVTDKMGGLDINNFVMRGPCD